MKTNANGTTYLVGVKDGKVKVVASITNEYGTFESEAVDDRNGQVLERYWIEL